MSKSYEQDCLRKRQANQALNMKSLAVAYGYAYGKVRMMSLMAGFPMVAGRIIPSDFDRWRDELVKGKKFETEPRKIRPRMDWKEFDKKLREQGL